MLQRVQRTYPFAWLLALAAFCLLAACGGSIGDSVTGSPVSVLPADLDLDPESAVAKSDDDDDDDGDDDDGDDDDRDDDDCEDDDDDDDECPTTTCPCFSNNETSAAVSTCSTPVAQCGTADPSFLLLSCDAGGNVPPLVLGVYLSETANGGSCARDDDNGSVTQNGLTEAEHQACVDIISSSEYCS